MTEESLKNLALIDIEKIMRTHRSTLHDFDELPNSIGSAATDEQNRLIIDELSYDRFDMATQLQNYMSSINNEQRNVFERIMEAVDGNRCGFFFVYGHGGTGKTFIWKTLSASI